jgi:biotin synthase-like enzyme
LHEAIQAIRIALRTEKNNIRNLDVGSYAYQMHHSLYKKKNDLKKIQEYIQEVVNTILPEATVTVGYADDEAAGYFRHQAVKAHINYYGKPLDEFIF